MSSHQCPAPGCTRLVPTHRLACKSHWFSLPPRLRLRLGRAYKAGDATAHLGLMVEAVALLHEHCVPGGECQGAMHPWRTVEAKG